MFLLLAVFTRDDISPWDFRMHVLIFNSDDGDIIDVMVFEEFAFKFSWCNLLPTYQYTLRTSKEHTTTYLKPLVLNQLLHPIRNVKVMIFVLISHVSGFEIAVFGDGVLSRLFVFPVAFEDVWTCEPQFAGLSGTEFFAVGGNVFGAHVWEHFSCGADGGVPFVPWLYPRNQ